MKIFNIGFNNFKLLIRNKKNLFFILLFPIIFMLIFGFVFSGNTFNETTLNIGVIDNDNSNLSNSFINVLEDMEYDNSKSMFNIINVSNEVIGDEMIENSTLDALIIIPKDFSADIQRNLISNQNNCVNLTIKGDSSSQNYGLFLGLFSGVIEGFSSQLLENTNQKTVNLISFENKALNGTSQFTTFDYIAPGLIVFAILMTVTAVSANIAKEVENGMITRLKLTRMKSRDYILGNLLSWSVLGIIQVIIMLIVAILLKFHWQGGFNSIIYAIIIGIITTFCSVALALIIVSVTKSSEQASNLAPIIAVPLSFLAGSFFPMQGFTIRIFGFSFDILELSPWYQASKALESVLTYGREIFDILPRIAIIILMSIILLAISIILFNYKLKSVNK